MVKKRLAKKSDVKFVAVRKPVKAMLHSNLPIVGMGASVGGINALLELFSSLPNYTNLAFVIVQHLAPTLPSHMANILSNATSMPVREIKD